MGQESCPRCGGPLRKTPKDQGVTSRYDEATTVCGDCGTAEGLIAVIDGAEALHPLTGKKRWDRWPASEQPAS